MGHIVQFRVMNLHQWPYIKLAAKARHFATISRIYISHMSPLLKTRASTSFILQALPWQRPEKP